MGRETSLQLGGDAIVVSVQLSIILQITTGTLNLQIN